MCIILKFSLLMEQFFVHNIIILSYILNFTQANCLELSLFTPNCLDYLFSPPLTLQFVRIPVNVKLIYLL